MSIGRWTFLHDYAKDRGHVDTPLSIFVMFWLRNRTRGRKFPQMFRLISFRKLATVNCWGSFKLVHLIGEYMEQTNCLTIHANRQSAVWLLYSVYAAEASYAVWCFCFLIVIQSTLNTRLTWRFHFTFGCALDLPAYAIHIKNAWTLLLPRLIAC